MVPDSLRHRLISQFHNSWFGGHEGVHKTVQRMQLYYFWPNMQNDVNDVIKACERCQKHATIPAIPPSSLQPLPTISAPNQSIHADLFGPLRTSASGKKYILVITDAFTRYFEVVAIENKEADCVTDAIFTHWICRYGVPAQMVTDQGKEFVAKVCQEIWKKLDLLHVTTSARHPQANAQAEVVNKTIARYLASFVNDTTLDWEPYLAPLMFSYNTAFHRSIKTSPFFLTYGVHPTLPNEITTPQYGSDLPEDIMARLQIARNIAREHMEKATEIYTQQFDKHSKVRSFSVGQPVLLDEHSFLGKNTKLAPKYTGPHVITRLVGDKNVELLLDNGKSMVVHVNCIKLFRTLDQPPGTFDSQKAGGVLQHQNKDAQQQIDDAEDEDNEVNPPRTEEQGVDRQSRRLTRSVTNKEGMVYNDQLKRFEHKPSLTVEVIRRTKKPTRKRPQVIYIPYIEVQDFVDFYHDELQVKEEPKVEPKEEVKDEWGEDFSLGEDYQVDRTADNDTWNNSLGYPEDTPYPVELSERRRIAFNPVAQYLILPEEEERTYQIPEEEGERESYFKHHPYFYDTGPKPYRKSLLRETIDGTAKVLFGDTSLDSETKPVVTDTTSSQGAQNSADGATGSQFLERSGRWKSTHGKPAGLGGSHPKRAEAKERIEQTSEAGHTRGGRVHLAGPDRRTDRPRPMDQADRRYTDDRDKIARHPREREGRSDGGLPGQRTGDRETSPGRGHSGPSGKARYQQRRQKKRRVRTQPSGLVLPPNIIVWQL
jgi:hypothetical protein